LPIEALLRLASGGRRARLAPAPPDKR